MHYVNVNERENANDELTCCVKVIRGEWAYIAHLRENGYFTSETLTWKGNNCNAFFDYWTWYFLSMED